MISSKAAMVAYIANLREFIESISYDEVHGCCTGDCPHDRANQCLTNLIKLIKERAEEARKLLAP